MFKVPWFVGPFTKEGRMTQKNPVYFENRLNVCLLAAERSWVEVNLQISQLQHKAAGANIDLELQMPIAASVKASLITARQCVEAALRVAREARGYLADHPESLRYPKETADRIITGFEALREPLERLEWDLKSNILMDRTEEMDRCVKNGDANRLAELFDRMWGLRPQRWREVRRVHQALHEDIYGLIRNIDPW
ncbi:hypothetical protein IT087_02690 [Candidatus Uhrbacteria bacterium]|nr:hypothetical protein [Candidatus Uhrbacteria bacterium]